LGQKGQGRCPTRGAGPRDAGETRGQVPRPTLSGGVCRRDGVVAVMRGGHYLSHFVTAALPSTNLRDWLPLWLLRLRGSCRLTPTEGARGFSPVAIQALLQTLRKNFWRTSTCPLCPFQTFRKNSSVRSSPLRKSTRGSQPSRSRALPGSSEMRRSSPVRSGP
jgi:hypothetical protein